MPSRGTLVKPASQVPVSHSLSLPRRCRKGPDFQRPNVPQAQDFAPAGQACAQDVGAPGITQRGVHALASAFVASAGEQPAMPPDARRCYRGQIHARRPAPCLSPVAVHRLPGAEGGGGGS